MFIKVHHPDQYIQYLLAVEDRITLQENDRINLFRYKSGLSGERMFYNLLKNILEGIKIWDITLDNNDSSQYDFLIVVDKVIYHFDVKNYSGVYTYKNDNFISENGRNYKNIMAQLDAAHDRLIRIVELNNWGYKVESKIIFINKQFSIRNYDGNPLILFHNQIDSFIQYLLKRKTYKNDLYVAEKLVELSNPKVFERIYYYPFEKMKSGPRCPKCLQINKVEALNKFKTVSCACGHTYEKSEMLHNIIDDLFHINQGIIKTKDVVYWSGVPERSVRRFLKQNYHSQGSNKNRSYVKNDGR
ncbi:nuclease-related domain-containing protein [Macrococcus epidermidis]|uniref:nuclease-related domain-containing protein n=1 Tax=Macrococcus epidermidis TaxID=1902580 RepID=UPI0020B7339F|nr:nuclease-related domain-containing protein [Macrococcus epidermidis]UTH17044.1 NERD domain-containing protein [Macrococcus epidermidis]